MIKVLISDDEEKVCQLICNLVDWKEKDMEIVGIAHNGIEALELAENTQPDLMITDIRMPGYDGLELIRRAKAVCPGVECIIISGYRHFDYAQNAIKYGVEDYLLKPINKEELEKTLDKIRHKYQVKMKKLSEDEYLKMRMESDMHALRIKLYTDMKQGEAVSDMEKINEEYHYRFKEGLFFVFYVKYDYGRRGEPESGTVLLTTKISQIVREILGERCLELEVFREDGGVCCIVNCEPEQMKHVQRGIRSILDELLVQKNIFGNVLFTIGRGSAFQSPEGISESMYSAKRSVEERILVGTDRVIEETVPDSEQNLLKMDTLAAEIMKKIDSAVETLDVQSVQEILQVLQGRLMEIDDIHGSGILRQIRETGKIYLLNLRKHGFRVEDEEGVLNTFLSRVEQCPRTDEVFGFLSQWIQRSMEALVEEKNQESTRPIRQAKQFIKENYKRPITLDEVSTFAGFNPTYFSTLFKKESGMNFLEYLSDVRMNRAKELLKETNMSVALICEEVGYSDLKHFTKSFKKNTGINPKDYRKLYS